MTQAEREQCSTKLSRVYTAVSIKVVSEERSCGNADWQEVPSTLHWRNLKTEVSP